MTGAEIQHSMGTGLFHPIWISRVVILSSLRRISRRIRRMERIPAVPLLFARARLRRLRLRPLPPAQPLPGLVPAAPLSLSSPTTSLRPNAHPELSTGAKVGIGVGSALAVIALLLLGFLIYQRRRRDGIKDGGIAGATESGGYQKAELDGQTVRRPAGEADGVRIFEADVDDNAIMT